MILGYHYGTVEDIELVWSFIALIGLVFSVFNLRDSLGDLRFLKRAGVKNGRLSVAKSNLYTELSRTIIQSIFLTIGIMALFLPAPPASSLPPLQLAIQVAFRWGLVISASLLALNTYLSHNLRKHLTEGENGH